MKDKIKKIYNDERIFAIIVTLIYAIVTSIIAYYYKDWRDEAQSWLLCKNLSFIDLLKQLKVEGHPFLWYAIIYPFIKLGCSIKIENIISWIFSVISVYIIERKFPIYRIGKIAIILVSPIIYTFSIVGRSYSLVVLLITILGALYNSKRKYPILYAILLGLLANTHVMIAGLSGILAITFYVYELTLNRKNNTKNEKKKFLIGLSIFILSGILLIMQLKSSNSSIVNKSASFKNFFTNNIIFKACYIEAKDISIYPINTYSILIYELFYLIFLIKKNTKSATIFIFTTLYQIILFYITSIWKQYILQLSYILLIFSMWTVLSDNENKVTWLEKLISIISLKIKNKLNSFKVKKKSNLATNIKKDNPKRKLEISKKSIDKIICTIIIIGISLCSISNSIFLYIREYYGDGSSAEKMGKYIINNVSQDSILLTYENDAITSSCIPYIKNIKMWSINNKKYYTYIDWNNFHESLYTKISIEKFENIIKENFTKDDKLYYLDVVNKNTIDGLTICLLENHKLEKMNISQFNSFFDESYDLYKLKNIF